jgi:hypothetical protein
MIQHQMRHGPAWWRDKEKLIGQPGTSARPGGDDRE